MQSGSEPQASVPSLPGGYTIAEIFEKRSGLEGKQVRVRGRVMKVNPNIMGLNWIHIQDGTGSSENNDLVVTSTEAISAGALVVVEGVVAVNRTFQSGYFFPLILENASLSTSMASAHSESAGM